MKKYGIGSRLLSFLLAAAMILSMVPAMQLGASAVALADGKFLTATEDGVKLLNNDETITLPIKINNFVNDGMMFEYLSSAQNNRDKSYYLYESGGYVQIYPFALDLEGRDVGVDILGNKVTDTINSDVNVNADSDGISNSLNLSGTLDDADNYIVNQDTVEGVYDQDFYGKRFGNASTTINSSMTPTKQTDNGGTSFMRLTPDGETYHHSLDNSGRAWRKITSFNSARTVDQVRYAVIVYRINIGSSSTSTPVASIDSAGTNASVPNYSNMLLSVNYFDEVKTDTSGANPSDYNRSNAVDVDLTDSGNWTYAIIDMKRTTADAIQNNTQIKDIYLRSALHYKDTGCSMDIAAVGYFPYYGDAEQFAFYGLTLGCKQVYVARNNAGFSFRNNTIHTKYTNATNVTEEEQAGIKDGSISTAVDDYDNASPRRSYFQYVGVKNVPDWIADSYKGTSYNGSRPFTFQYADVSLRQDTDSSDYKAFVTTGEGTTAVTEEIDLIDEIGYALFGEVDGAAAVGLLESSLDENGLPVYKKSVVNYFAAYLRNRLCGQYEYPASGTSGNTGNYGWRNYSFIRGSSTSNGTNEALYGTDSLGRPLDLASAICEQLKVTKGNGQQYQKNYVVYATAAEVADVYGSYSNTIAHKDELLGSWDAVKGNISTWYDAAYYLLHNFYATDSDVAANSGDDVDGYGQYEDTYQYLVLPQAEITDDDGNKTTAYFFDSGYAKGSNTTAMNTWSSALDYSAPYIKLDPTADGKALFCTDVDPETYTNLYPFLPTSGNNATGESNSVYYMHDGVVSRGTYAYTYQNRDFHYSMRGNGFFGYEKDLYFEFEGDDDVYLFINGELVMDIGGTHAATFANIYIDDYVDWAWSVKNNEATYKGKTYAQLTGADRARVDALALVEGGIYSFDFFYMERHGVGSNLRIVTNIEITEEGLDVDKFAYQDGKEIDDNEMFDVDERIEYGFSITNNSDSKLYDLTFSDPIIGVSLNSTSGLVVDNATYVTDVDGGTLEPKDLLIEVSGYDSSGNAIAPITVSCETQEELKAFLYDLEGDGLQSDKDTGSLYAGDGLWKDATIKIRGIFYTLTDAQKSYSSFRNYIVASGDAGDVILRGSANHTVYQPGNPAYYQWVGHKIVIESERLHEDLIRGNVVTSSADLPDIGNMILIPSTADGSTYVEGYLSGGDVHLTIEYPEVGTYMDYVTILDLTDPAYKLTVPVTIYVTDVTDSVFVLDYGLDTYLTDDDAIFTAEFGIDISENVTGTVMGIAGTKTTFTNATGKEVTFVDADGKIVGAEYLEYQTGDIDKAIGNTQNELTLIGGTYTESTGLHNNTKYELESSIYLDHNKPWVIEWEAGALTKSCMLFTMTDPTRVEGNKYIYLDGFVKENEKETSPMISMGYCDGNGVFYNYGVVVQEIVDTKTTHKYKLYNVPGYDGMNKVYLSVDDKVVGAMEQYNANGTPTPDVTDDWVSGQDFTFNYIGATGHLIGISKLSYLRVYEDGYDQYTHYRWEASTGDGLKEVDTGKLGNVINTATKEHGTVSSNMELTDNVRWKLAEDIVLNNDQAWEVSFKTKVTANTLVLSSHNYVQQNGTYIFLNPTNNLVCMGYRGASAHINYAVQVTEVLSDFDMDSNEYTYKLKNIVHPDGSNMVYLYVDGTLIGALDKQCNNSSYSSGVDSNGISGMDFVFSYIGSANGNAGNTNISQFGFGYTSPATLSFLEVQTRTKLTTVYEWKTANADGTGKFVNVNATSDGNRIQFAKEADGVVETEQGVFTLYNDKLKFETKDFMNSIQSIYVAITIHDKEFVPTRLNDNDVEVGAEVQMYKKVTVLPANVVYYEDDFPAIHYYGEEKNTFTILSENTEYIASGSSSDLTQSPDQNTNYGSDETYSDTFSKISGGSLHTIAINNDGPLAWFSYTGRGFEIDARTNATDSGMLLVKVFQKSALNFDPQTGYPTDLDSAAVTQMIPVITEFDNGNVVNDKFQIDNNGTETLYQVPVIRFDTSKVDDYVVVIYGLETLDYDNDMAHVDTYLHLDGIRIYRPMGTIIEESSQNKDKINYYGDQNNAIFEELRDHILEGNILACDYSGSAGSSVSTGTVTWTEKFNSTDYTKESYLGNAVSSVNDYLMDGPNNEVYIDGTFTNGAIAFYVREMTATNVGAKKLLHIGVRAIDAGMYYGSGSTGMRANLQLGVLDSNGDPKWLFLDTVSSGTEQYISVPFELCPTVSITEGETVRNYYQVVIKVAPFSEDTPALVAFSNIKRTSGLAVCETQFDAESMVQNDYGEWELESSSNGFSLLSRLSLQMAATDIITENEVEPGAYFEIEDTDTETETTPVITPQYPSLSLDEEVIYNIYFDTTGLDDVALDDMGLILFDSMLENGTIHDAIDVIPGAFYSEANGYYMVRTNGIPAKNLGDNIYFKVYAKNADGSYVYSKTLGYSAVQYAQEILARPTGDEMKALCVAMLNYGAAAQVYFEYKMDDLMNAGLTAEQKALVKAFDSSMITDISDLDSTKIGSFVYSKTGFRNAMPTVSFDGAFAINYYITPDRAIDGDMMLYYWTQEAFDSAAELTVENASGVVAMEQLVDGSYGYTYSDIAAKQINDAVYVSAVYSSNGTEYCTGVLAYSIGAYCEDLIADNDSVSGQELAAATAVYGYYADKYFAD